MIRRLVFALAVAAVSACAAGSCEPAGCAAKGHATTRLTCVDIAAEQARLDCVNAYPNNTNIDPDTCPVILEPLGNGLVVQERYFCSDVCPDNGGVVIVYKDIGTPEDCRAVDGTNIFDAAWGGYIGCAPC